MPRPKNTSPSRKRDIFVNAELLDEVEFRLMDDFTGKTKYGAFSQLVERLLRTWLKEQKDRETKATKRGSLDEFI